MPLTVPDMSTCDRKCKCCRGVNEGSVYPCANPCSESNEDFDEELCECIAGLPSSPTWLVDYIFYSRSGRFCFESAPPDYDGSANDRQKILSNLGYSCTPIEWVHVGSNRCTGLNCKETGVEGVYDKLTTAEFLLLTGADYEPAGFDFICGEQDVLYLKVQNDVNPAYGAFSGAIGLLFIQNGYSSATNNWLGSRPVSFNIYNDPSATVFPAATIPTLFLTQNGG